MIVAVVEEGKEVEKGVEIEDDGQLLEHFLRGNILYRHLMVILQPIYTCALR